MRSLVCSCGARVPVSSAPRRKRRLSSPPAPRRRRGGRPRPPPPAGARPRASRPAASPGLAALPRPARGGRPPRWLGPLLPAPSGGLDRDPVALLLAALATLLALAYALLAAAGARPAARAVVIGLGAVLLVALPSAAFIGWARRRTGPTARTGASSSCRSRSTRSSPARAPTAPTTRARSSPARRGCRASGTSSGATRSCATTRTCRARTSSCCRSTCAGRACFGGFDPRVVTLLFYGLVVVLAARFPASVDGRLCAAGIAALNPLVYWHQIFGANDLVFVAMILGAVLLARGSRPLASRSPPRPRLRHQAACLALRAVPPRGTVRRPLLPRPRRRRAVAAPLRARGGGGGGLRGRRRSGRGPGLPGVLGRHRGLQRRAARGRQLPVRGNARVRLRELSCCTSAGWPACGTTSRSRSSTCSSCRWASCSCARSFGTGTRSGRWPRGARRSSRRSTSRVSSTRTT